MFGGRIKGFRMPSPGRLSLSLLLLVSLSGFQQPPKIGPNGDGTLLASDDRQWLLLQSASIAADTEKGEYSAQFSPALAKMNGRPFRISGYMLPIETDVSSRHFIITRRSAGCPFCAPPELTEAVEVFLAAPIRYTAEPISVRGRLHLVSHSDAGLFYRVGEATVA